MIEFARLLARLFERFGYRPAAVYADRTINILTRAYVPMYLFGLFGPMIFKSAWPAWLAIVVCGLLSYLFGLRLVLPVVLYRMVNRDEHHQNGPTAGDVWYIKAYAAMWASAPLFALAILPVYNTGWYLPFLAVVFGILHIVATQRGAAPFWRKVYATSITIIAIGLVAAIIWPNKVSRFTGAHHRSELVDQVKEEAATLQTNSLTPRLREVESKIAAANDMLQYNKINNLHPEYWVSLEAEIERLKGIRTQIQSEISVFSNTKAVSKATSFAWLPDFSDINSLGIAILLVGAAIVLGWKRDGH